MAKESGDTGLADWPTATHSQSLRQVSPAGFVDPVPGLGVLGTIDHEVPFQLSAREAGEGALEASAHPTALHEVALKQSTPVRAWASVADVWGVPGWTNHCCPFQSSIRLCVGLLPTRPTA